MDLYWAWVGVIDWLVLDEDRVAGCVCVGITAKVESGVGSGWWWVGWGVG